MPGEGRRNISRVGLQQLGPKVGRAGALTYPAPPSEPSDRRLAPPQRPRPPGPAPGGLADPPDVLCEGCSASSTALRRRHSSLRLLMWQGGGQRRSGAELRSWAGRPCPAPPGLGTLDQSFGRWPSMSSGLLLMCGCKTKEPPARCCASRRREATRAAQSRRSFRDHRNCENCI